MLYEIAALTISVACLLWATAQLLKALGIKVKDKTPELTPEERELFEAQTKASLAYAKGIDNILGFGGTDNGK